MPWFQIDTGTTGRRYYSLEAADVDEAERIWNDGELDSIDEEIFEEFIIDIVEINDQA